MRKWEEVKEHKQGTHVKQSHRECKGGSVLQGKIWKQCGSHFKTALHWLSKRIGVVIALQPSHWFRLSSQNKSPGISWLQTNRLLLPESIPPLRIPNFGFWGEKIHNEPMGTTLVKRPKRKCTENHWCLVQYWTVSTHLLAFSYHISMKRLQYQIIALFPLFLLMEIRGYKSNYRTQLPNNRHSFIYSWNQII